jgi:NAD(P)-dependent dehydrogenase (short-subunit alcohol dehydrogenase family)
MASWPQLSVVERWETALLDIQGKWVLLTGASRGIGRQVVGALADGGCRLILHSRKREHTAALVADLRARGLTVHALEAELSDQQQVVALGEEALRISGGIDILYNNAAIQADWHEDKFATIVDEYRLSFQVNTIAPITLCNLILPSMIERGFGRVVNITSGIKDQPELMAYAASKAALDKYVYDMAPHLAGTGVTMNLLDPGWLRTDLGGPQAPNAVESVLPGAMVPVLLEDGSCGKWFSAQDYR